MQIKDCKSRNQDRQTNLRLTESSENGIRIGLQEMENFLRQMHTGGSPQELECGTLAAEVSANARAEAGKWKGSLEGH